MPEFALWKAAYRVDPWGDDWRQAATVAAEIHNQGQLNYAATLAAGGALAEPDIRQQADYIPFARKIKPKLRRRTVEESEAAAAAMYG